MAAHVFLTWELTHPHYAGVPLHLIDDESIYDPERLVAFFQRTKSTQVQETPILCWFPQSKSDDKVFHTVGGPKTIYRCN